MTEDEQRPGQARIGSVLLNQYRIESVLGQGGMGTVYSGIQLSVNRPVAIKLISGPVAHNPESVRRFRREAEAMARLRHPNTVRLFEFGVTEGNELFMVMELLEGSDLAQHISERRALPVFEAMNIARQTLESLSEAHALGIVHRDLKPANIFLSKLHGGQVVAKVMDFGIAGIEQGADATRLTLAGAVMGTPLYMSPEQALGKQVDGRSDLYSLGITLFEMLAGKAPFEADTAASLLLAHVATQPPRLLEARPDGGFSAAVQELLDRLLDKNPEQRPRTADEVLGMVDAIMHNEVAAGSGGRFTPAKGSVEATRLASGQQAGLPHSVQAATVPAVPRRKFTWAIAAAPVVLGAGVWLFWPSSKPDAADKVLAPAPVGPSAEGELRSVHIVSSPANASVLMSGVELGKTPYDVQFRKATDLTLMLAGYEPAALHLTPDSEPNLAVELVAVPPEAKTTVARHEAKRVGQVAPEPSVPPPPPTAAPATIPANQAAPKPQSPPPPVPPPPPPTGTPATQVPVIQTRPAPQPAVPVAQPTTQVRSPAAFIRDPAPGRERREVMLARGAPYPNVATAKRALRSGQIDEGLFRDVAWVLKAQRNKRINTEKLNYKQGLITRSEYDRRVKLIDREYEGE